MGSALYDYRCKVLSWLDGDTADVEIDLGFDLSVRKRVRVYGLNCPEIHSKDGAEKAAGLVARAQATALAPEGKSFFMRSFKEGVDDKFGRFLATIKLPDGKDFAEEMISRGAGKAYFGERKPAFTPMSPAE